MNMEDIFDINVSKDRLSVMISYKNKGDSVSETLTPKLLNDWLQTKKILFGIDQKVVISICNNPKNGISPVEIAKGITTRKRKRCLLN